MSKGLLIETSSENCSVGISINGHLIYYLEDNKEFRHAELLHVFIQQCLMECDLQPTDLHYIGIGTGPGSYTGLRIGYAAAKAMAYALNIPLVGIYSTHSVCILAMDNSPKADKIYIMLDAGRMEVYLSVHDSNGNFIQEPRPTILYHEFISGLGHNEKILLAGNGVNKIIQWISKNQNILIKPGILPSVKGMDKILYDKFLKNHFLDVPSCEPDYLKEYQFKRKKAG